MKRILYTVLIGFISFIVLGCDMMSSRPDNTEKGKSKEKYFVISETEKQGAKFSEELDKAKIVGDHVRLSKKYFEEGNYQEAISEAKKAIELSRFKSEEGLPRWYLSKIYEQNGDYDLAIKEINWLIDNYANEDGKKELLQRKENLQKLMQ